MVADRLGLPFDGNPIRQSKGTIVLGPLDLGASDLRGAGTGSEAGQWRGSSSATTTRTARRSAPIGRQYELSHRDLILASGSLREDDGVTKVGSLVVLDVATRQEAEAFFAKDPATRAGLRGVTDVRWVNVAILDRHERS